MILVSEFMPAVGIDALQEAGHEVLYRPDLATNRPQLEAAVGQARALIVRNMTRVDAPLLALAPVLRAVGRLGVGLDNIDLRAADTRGVKVIWARGANAIAVAEYVLAALLLHSRNLSAAFTDVASGGWDRTRFGGVELSGKTLGLIGLGEVGLRVAARARAFGMRVLACDPGRSPGEAVVEELGIDLRELSDVFRESDYVSLHAPLTSETRHLINRESLALFRPGAILINTARGGLVEGAALVDAVSNGHLAGAVLDVVDPEPLAPDDPLRHAAGIHVTPHIAGLTSQAQDRIARQVVEGVLAALEERA